MIPNMCLIYKNNKAPDLDQENITLYKVYLYRKDLNRLSSPYFIGQKGSIVTQPGLQISSILSDQLLDLSDNLISDNLKDQEIEINGFHAFKNVESAQSYLYYMQCLPLPLLPLMQLSLNNNTQYVVLTVTALKTDVVAEGMTQIETQIETQIQLPTYVVSQLTIDENEFYKFVHRPIVKKYGKDFRSLNGTLNENDIGTDQHGWTVSAQLHILHENYTWVNEFQASQHLRKSLGKLRIRSIYSEAAYQNFCQYHTPNEFTHINPPNPFLGHVANCLSWQINNKK